MRFTVTYHSGLSSVQGFEVEGLRAKDAKTAMKKVRTACRECPAVRANRTCGRGAVWSAREEVGRRASV